MLEREYKFWVEGSFPDVAALQRDFAPLGVTLGRPRRVSHQDVYYDTPDCALSRERVALRIRRRGDAVLATYKGRGTVTGSLNSREEIEVPYRAPWPPEIMDKLPLGTAGRLEPLVLLTTTRTSHPLGRAGQTLAELAFDEVVSSYGRRTVQFKEVELEAGPNLGDEALLALAEPLLALGLQAHQSDKLTHALSGLGVLEATL